MLKDRAVFAVGKNEIRGRQDAEAEAFAWAESQGVTHLVVEFDD